MAKRVAFDDEARRALMRGVDRVARAVRATLGPAGGSVLVSRAEGLPTTAIDGALALDIELDDPLENVGARFVQEVSARTRAEAGDGTTTAVVLAQAIVARGLAQVAAGANPVAVKRGLDRAAAAVFLGLSGRSAALDGSRELTQLAALALPNDTASCRVLVDALAHAGTDGFVWVEEGPGTETTLELWEGLRFEGGYLSPYFVTDPARLEVAFEGPLVVVVDNELTTTESVLPYLARGHDEGRPLLVIAHDVREEALSTLVVNTLRGAVRSVAVSVAARGDRRRALLEDIAVVCGTEPSPPGVVGGPAGLAQRVRVDHERTSLVGAGAHAERLQVHRAQIEASSRAADTASQRQHLAKRQSRLAGGVAVIRAGGRTPAAARRTKLNIEDALASLRAALREGIVPGGGLTLLRLTEVVGGLGLAGDEALGAQVLGEALSEPLRRIAINAGASGDLVVSRVRQAPPPIGFNAQRRAYENLAGAGILDPTLVVRTALATAVSIAGLMLTTDAVVADEPETDQDGQS